MLSSPNDESPANVEAAVSGYLFINRSNVVMYLNLILGLCGCIAERMERKKE